MKPIFRISAHASIKLKGKRTFKSMRRSFDVDATVKALSPEMLEQFATALLRYHFGANNVTNVRWVEVQQGIFSDDIGALWEE
jgi:hypothetical protein